VTKTAFNEYQQYQVHVYHFMYTLTTIILITLSLNINSFPPFGNSHLNWSTFTPDFSKSQLIINRYIRQSKELLHTVPCVTFH